VIESTIGDTKKSEGKLRSFASLMEGMDVSSKKRKVMRLAEDEKQLVLACVNFLC